jgi:hypothetical protein
MSEAPERTSASMLGKASLTMLGNAATEAA